MSLQAGKRLGLVTPDGKSYVYGHATNASDLYLVEGLK